MSIIRDFDTIGLTFTLKFQHFVSHFLVCRIICLAKDHVYIYWLFTRTHRNWTVSIPKRLTTKSGTELFLLQAYNYGRVTS